jgi:hypothetical protein
VPKHAGYQSPTGFGAPYTAEVINRSYNRYPSNHVPLHPVVVLRKCKNTIATCTTPFLLLCYFVATCFGLSGPSSGHKGAVSEVKLYVKLQLK